MRIWLDMSQALVASGSLLVASWLSVGLGPISPMFAQILGQPPGAPTPDTFIDFAARNGAAGAILALVLFFYRRDWRELTDYKGQRETSLTLTVAENVKALTEMSAALRENTIVVHQAKNILASHIGPATRAGDRPSAPATQG